MIAHSPVVEQAFWNHCRVWENARLRARFHRVPSESSAEQV